jgi:hypothetical protein
LGQMDGLRRFQSGKVQARRFELVYVLHFALAKGCAYFERALHRVTCRALGIWFAFKGRLNRVQLNTCTELGLRAES